MIPLKTKADKRFALNLNVYRNTHYQNLNKAKVLYKELMHSQIAALPVFDVVDVEFTFFPGARRRTDIGNVCSIHEKFFMDSLVECGKLLDDDYTRHPKTVYKFGEVDKHDPRVEIVITELQ